MMHLYQPVVLRPGDIVVAINVIKRIQQTSMYKLNSSFAND